MLTQPMPVAAPARGPKLSEPLGPMKAAGVLAFGISIPFLTGLYGPIRPDDLRFWAGFLWFIALAAAIWLGNRWLLFKQREHFDWFANPWRKLAMLVTANMLYTAPLTVAWLYAWTLAPACRWQPPPCRWSRSPT